MRRRNVLDDINKRGNGVVTESQKRDAESKSTLTENQVAAADKSTDVPKETGTAIKAPLDINPADLKVETPQVNAANPTASVQPSAPTPADVNNAQIAKTPSLVSQETREKYPDVTDSSQYLAWLRREEERDRDMQKAQLKREMWGSLGEGLGAIGDLYFSTKGAPLPTNKANVSDKMRERYTRMKAEADRDRHERMNNYLRILQQNKADEYNQKRLDLRNRELEERQERYAASNKAREIRAIAAAEKDMATAKRLYAWANDIENMSDAKKANMEADTRLKDARAIAERQKGNAAVTNANANQTRANNSAAGGGKNGSSSWMNYQGNTPPSQQNNGQKDNNTPPSRRK